MELGPRCSHPQENPNNRLRIGNSISCLSPALIVGIFPTFSRVAADRVPIVDSLCVLSYSVAR